jgi:hypothetical protein
MAVLHSDGKAQSTSNRTRQKCINTGNKIQKCQRKNKNFSISYFKRKGLPVIFQIPDPMQRLVSDFPERTAPETAKHAGSLHVYPIKKSDMAEKVPDFR